MPDYCDLFADSGAEEATGNARQVTTGNENHKTLTERGAARQTTNLSLGSLMAVMTDTAVTSDKFRPNMATHFLIGCCFGL